MVISIRDLSGVDFLNSLQLTVPEGQTCPKHVGAATTKTTLTNVSTPKTGYKLTILLGNVNAQKYAQQNCHATKPEHFFKKCNSGISIYTSAKL